jgi:hypothetical protein
VIVKEQAPSTALRKIKGTSQMEFEALVNVRLALPAPPAKEIEGTLQDKLI